MLPNQSRIERVIRIILGVLILSLLYVGPKSDWGYLGIIPLATGLIGWCPLYQLFSSKTKQIK